MRTNQSAPDTGAMATCLRMRSPSQTIYEPAISLRSSSDERGAVRLNLANGFNDVIHVAAFGQK